MITWTKDADGDLEGFVGYNVFDIKGRELGHWFMVFTSGNWKFQATRAGKHFGAGNFDIHKAGSVEEAMAKAEAKATEMKKKAERKAAKNGGVYA